MPNPPDLRHQIQTALAQFAGGDLKTNTLDLLNALGYRSNKQLGLPEPSAQGFMDELGDERFNPTNALLSEWRYVDLVLQLTQAELDQSGQRSLFDAKSVDRDNYNSYLIFCIELAGSSYSRTALAKSTREINKMVKMPALVLFKHGATLTLAVIDRRLGKRDPSIDVLDKVTLIKDIRIPNPLVGTNAHRAHIEILYDLSLPKLAHDHTVTNFTTFHEAWRTVLDTSELNKKFFRELANWFYWAQAHVTFPDGAGKNQEERNATSLIRLITRLIFTWFIQEKNLVPDALFDEDKVRALLNDFDPKGDTYYKAVLQNLFFGTLNTEMKTAKGAPNRKFIKPDTGFPNPQHMVHNVCRYENAFANPAAFLNLTATIPFLNGGLFECLDKDGDTENKRDIIRIDGFSERIGDQLRVPNYLFFARKNDPKYFTTKDNTRLNETFGTKNKNYEVRGLVRLLHRYKFTIDENTPIEQEIALDPELLGKVFENLLAAYNPETGVTARKQTGSFYTPREIVNYMVDESLIAYLSENLRNLRGFQNLEGLDTRLRHLLAYNNDSPQFNPQETAKLIQAIDNLKLLDPACGSGAFPLGALHKLVFILHKLDPDNARWKEKQIEKMREIPDPEQRDKAIQDVELAFNRNELDYGRKLYLIENCIYGVDIQPIAVQIAKLRCFISLIVDERVDDQRENRGIRPLPNLETKFVAANTLIGIEKPAQMMFRNLAIAQKEKELTEVRRSLFTARTRETKEKHRKRDAALRKEIGELLKKDGWLPSTANQLAAWDPYDQNAHAEFFDAEWMFGISDGFDVVIGNPPYISHDKIRDKKEIKIHFESFEPFADIYCYFIERGVNLLCSHGFLSFITSNSYLRAEYGSPLRKWLRKNTAVRQIINIEDSQVFESAIVNVAILMGEKNAADTEKLCRVVNSPYFGDSSFEEFVGTHGFDTLQNTFDAKSWSLAKPEVFEVKRKIESKGKTLEALGTKIRLGLATGHNEAFILDDSKRRELIKQNSANGKIIKPLVRGRDISRYGYDFANLYILLTKNGVNVKRDYPDIYRYLDSFGRDFKNRGAQGENWWNLRASSFFEDFKKEKIIWIELTDVGRFALCAEELYLLNTAYFMLPPDGYPSKYLLGILNSTTMYFYLGQIAETSGMGVTRWINNYVKEFPIPKPTNDMQPRIVKLVDRILAAKRADPSADTTALEREIDQIVYQLYGLTEQEIAIVEGKKSP